MNNDLTYSHGDSCEAACCWDGCGVDTRTRFKPVEPGRHELGFHFVTACCLHHALNGERAARGKRYGWRARAEEMRAEGWGISTETQA